MPHDEWVTLTRPAEDPWPATDDRFRRWEKSSEIGRGDEVWRWAAGEVLRWGVETRSGFRVTPDRPAAEGARPVITAHPFGLSIREPVEVVAVVEEARRVGFAYRTLPGHPVSGEEAFILSRDGDAVILTIRSLTRAAEERGWRAGYPVLRIAQAVARRRYFRALRQRAQR